MLLQTAFFQNFLVGQITKTLSKNLHTTVSIKHVDFELFDRMLLEKTLVLDQKQDTLLSAGAVSVSITDWFFFKDKIDLKYIGLDDAVIKLNRKTPEWNYQFLVDYFGTGKQSNKTKSRPIDLNLKVLSLKNVSIFQQDLWVGTDMYVSVKNMRLDAEKLDIANKNLNITQLSLDQPVFAQYEYDGLRPPKKARTPSEADSINNVAWNPDFWMIRAKNINIKNAKVAIEREGKLPSVLGEFDDNHIILSQLNATLKNTRLVADTLTSEVDFSVKDRGGFYIKKFNSQFRMTPKSMEFSSLNIETNKSKLGDYFSMTYNSFHDDMQDFIHAVKMKGKFKNSIIDSDDLAYFAPDTKNWGTVFNVSGEVSGRVDNLTGVDMAIQAGNNNFLYGDMSLRGLPDIDESFMDLRIREMRTTMRELSKIIPAIKNVDQPNLSAFGNVRFSGSFTGYFHDFVTFGNLSTDIGNLKTDLHLKVPKNSAPVYNGSVSTSDFNLGKFIENPNMGIVAFDGKIDGKGFSEKAMDITINGTIHKIQFNGYDYTNIIAHGNIKKDVFSGSASINDPNIRIDTLIGTINFSRDHPFFNFDADILTLNLKKIGFTNDDISLTGRFDFDFTGKNIDNFLGSAKVTNAMLFDNGKQLSFDSLTIASSQYNDQKVLTLRTNELDATINGNFRIKELPVAFQLFLSRYYPAYIKRPEGKIENQDFSFMIYTRSVSEYVKLFDKNLSGFDESVIQGQINIANNHMELEATIPKIQFATIAFNDIHMNGLGNNDTLRFHTDIDDVVVNDSLHSPKTVIEAIASNDVSDVQITTSPDNTFYSADLSARIKTNSDGFTLAFNPSTFTLNQKKWTIEKGGEIELIQNMIIANHVRFYQNGQEISVVTKPSDISNSNDVFISLKNLVIEDITPFIFKTPKMEGLLNGNVQVANPFNKPKIDFNTSLNQFFFEGDSIGTIQAKGNYFANNKSFSALVNSNNDPYRFQANFRYYPQDSISPLAGNIDFDHSSIHILENYLEGILSDLHGRGTGRLNISGRIESPKLTGSMVLDSTSLKVDYTQCKYNLAEKSVITFNADEIDFGTITLLDINNKKATLTGKIYHNFFDNFFFNELHINTANNFQLLNTTSRDNNQFYGTLTGRAELTLNGFITDMRMSIKGQPTDSSHIFLPISETAESGSLDYIEFIQFGREMTVDKRVRENTNIKVDMELTANPLARIDVILDETTGDIIKAQGSGKLFISAGTRDPLTIRGRYTVEEGQYTFNFQTFLKTPFTLQQGFIEWQGDPYLAMLNIDAIYRAENVNLDNIPTSTGFSNTQGDIDIIFKLRGTLKNPSPQFEFQFPFDNPLKSDPIAAEYLKTRFQSDNNEMLNQVASLLLFNTFLTTDQGLLAGNATGNFVSKTVGQLLSATLTSSLNTWLQKLLKTNTVNLYTNINTSDFNFQKNINEKQIQNIGKFGLKYAFPNNKFILNIGSNVNYKANPGLANSNSDLLITPDISFEYLISPGGNLRVVGFNRSDIDPVNLTGIASRNRTGIQLSYRKDFETFEEFFTGKKKLARK